MYRPNSYRPGVPTSHRVNIQLGCDARLGATNGDPCAAPGRQRERSGEVSSPTLHHDRRLWRQRSGFRTCSSTIGDHATSARPAIMDTELFSARPPRSGHGRALRGNTRDFSAFHRLTRGSWHTRREAAPRRPGAPRSPATHASQKVIWCETDAPRRLAPILTSDLIFSAPRLSDLALRLTTRRAPAECTPPSGRPRVPDRRKWHVSMPEHAKVTQ